MKNICFDIGNSTIKVAVFSNEEMVKFWRFEHSSLCDVCEELKSYNSEHGIVCSSTKYTDELKGLLEHICPNIIYLNSNTPVPIKNLYHTPETLGMDRLAAAVGAFFQTKSNTAVIDIGTAITYDIITEKGEYVGGNIAPGIDMRFKALHEWTAKLPLEDENGEIPDIGYDTHSAIRSGVINGIKYEISGFIHDSDKKFNNLCVFLTDEHKIDFENSLKNRIFADKFVVLKGLNIILNKLLEK